MILFFLMLSHRSIGFDALGQQYEVETNIFRQEVWTYYLRFTITWWDRFIAMDQQIAHNMMTSYADIQTAVKQVDSDYISNRLSRIVAQKYVKI